MYNEQCKRYLYDLFHYWLDPNQDSNFKDDVAGFRIDHMIDNLDWKDNVVPNMFTQFWRPLFQELKKSNPAVRIMDEQANWEEYGARYFLQADLDYSFAFQIHNGIIALDKKQIIGKTDGNDIPRREAFEWFENWDTTGIALWYKDSGPCWDDTNLKKSDGISLEEQQKEEASIWRFYNINALLGDFLALAD